MNTDDDVLDMRHLIQVYDPDEDGSDGPENKENLVQWDTYSSTTSALELLERMNPLDGKARRRIRRAQERKHKKK